MTSGCLQAVCLLSSSLPYLCTASPTSAHTLLAVAKEQPLTHSSLASPHCPFFLCLPHVGDPRNVIWDTGMDIINGIKGHSCLVHIISFWSWKACLDPHSGLELECLGGVEKRREGLAALYDVFEEEGSVKGRLFQDVG